MDFKVINIDGDQVCIRRDRTDEGESVVVSAFLQDDEGDELLQEYEYAFNSAADAQRFVRDFSGKSARQFLEEQYREIGATSALEGGEGK
jgi:hypothetical protein